MIKIFDVLGPKPKLFIDSQESYKTVLGGTLTILLAIITTLCFIAFGIDLLERKRPEISSSKVINMNSKINGKDLIYVLAPMFAGGIEIKEIERKLNFTFRFAYRDGLRNDKPTIFDHYQMVRCSDTNLFINNLNNINSSLIGSPKTFWCLPENFNRTLEGKFGNPKYGTIQFFIRPCINSTSNNNNCYPDEQIRKELDTFFLQFIYNDYYMDLTDYELPFKQLWASEMMQCSSSSLRSDEITHKVVSLTTDSGWILETESVYNTYQFERKTALVLSKLSDLYVMIRLDVSNLNEQFTRKYIRLQAVLANTGGFIKFIMMISLWINHFFSNNKLYENFLIKKINKNNLLVNNNSFKYELNNADSVIQINNINKNNFIGNEKQFKKIINYQKLSIFKMICLFRKKLTYSQKLLKAYKELSMKKVNPDNIIKLFSRLEMTEKLLLDPEAFKLKKILFHTDLVNKLSNHSEINKSKEKVYYIDLNSLLDTKNDIYDLMNRKLLNEYK